MEIPSTAGHTTLNSTTGAEAAKRFMKLVKKEPMKVICIRDFNGGRIDNPIQIKGKVLPKVGQEYTVRETDNYCGIDFYRVVEIDTPDWYDARQFAVLPSAEEEQSGELEYEHEAILM